MTTNNFASVLAGIRALSDDDFAKLTNMLQPSTGTLSADVAPAPQGEDRLCDAYSVTTGLPCKHSAKHERRVGGRVRHLCGVHATVPHGNLRFSAAGAAALQSKRDESFKALCERTNERKQARKQAPARVEDTPWLTLANIADRLPELEPGTAHKVMGVTCDAWRAHCENTYGVKSWDDQGVGQGATVVCIARKGKQGRSADVKRGIYIPAQ